MRRPLSRLGRIAHGLRTAADPKFPIDIDGVTQIAQQCNTKKEASKLAQEMSQHLYLCSLLNDLTAQYGPVVRQAKVIGVLDEAFDVLVPDFGIEKRVHIDQMPIEVRATAPCECAALTSRQNHVHDEHSNELKIYWKPGVNGTLAPFAFSAVSDQVAQSSSGSRTTLATPISFRCDNSQSNTPN